MGHMSRAKGLIPAMTVIMSLTWTARAADFATGDLYLYTHAYPGLTSALLRIDPVSGAKTVIHNPSPYVSSHTRISYDPHRDRLVIRESTELTALVLVDSLGNTSALPFNWSTAPGGDPVIMWAPTGDGRIFLMTNAGRVAYIDAAGQGHDLYDTDGTTPFTFPFLTTHKEDLIYDVGTNSLFLVHWGAATVVNKFPLSVDGTQLAAAPQTVTYDAFLPTADEPMGVSAGPNGTIFIKIDTNSNADGVRMFTVDPATLAFADFAIMSYPFVAGNVCGTYNSVHGYGASLDSFNDMGYILTFAQSGSVQAGTQLASDVSDDCCSGDSSRMISIGDTINGFDPCPADTNGSGTVDVTDLLGLLAAWGTADPTYDIAPPGGDGFVGVQDLLALLAAWGPC